MRKSPLQDVIVKQPLQHGDAGFQRPVRPPLTSARPTPRHSAPDSEVLRQEMPPREFERPRAFQEQTSRGHRLDEDFEPTHSRKWPLIALGIGAVVILCAVALSLLFAGATVNVYPKQDTVVVNTTFTAGSAEGDAITFQPIVVERTANRSVSALGESQVEERASGKITIYNEYSDTPQRLIKRTRFESADGKIYRISNAVEVPGKKANGTPGSIEVLVTAEEPGESYNTAGAEAFSIPGFKGTPQEKLVYAKSTESFVGGFSGVKRTVSEAERNTALQELEQQLRDELFAAAFSGADQPAGYYLSKDAVFYEFTALPDESVEADKVTLSLSGKLHGVLFNTDALARLLAGNTLSAYSGEPIRIENIADVVLRLEPKAVQELGTRAESDMSAPWEASLYDVRAEGKAHFIWSFDEKKLAQDLAGQDKEVLDSAYTGSLLSSYAGIDRIEATIRPFWKQSFPDDPEDIVVVTKLDE